MALTWNLTNKDIESDNKLFGPTFRRNAEKKTSSWVSDLFQNIEMFLLEGGEGGLNGHLKCICQEYM